MTQVRRNLIATGNRPDAAGWLEPEDLLHLPRVAPWPGLFAPGATSPVSRHPARRRSMPIRRWGHICAVDPCFVVGRRATPEPYAKCETICRRLTIEATIQL